MHGGDWLDSSTLNAITEALNTLQNLIYMHGSGLMSTAWPDNLMPMIGNLTDNIVRLFADDGEEGGSNRGGNGGGSVGGGTDIDGGGGGGGGSGSGDGGSGKCGIPSSDPVASASTASTDAAFEALVQVAVHFMWSAPEEAASDTAAGARTASDDSNMANGGYPMDPIHASAL